MTMMRIQNLLGTTIRTRINQTSRSILATRGTLRVLPFLGTDDRIGDRVKSRFVLSVFHALAAAWTRTEFPEFVSSNLSLAAARDISPFAPTSPSAALFIGQAAAHVGNSAGHQARGAAASYARAADLQIRQALHSLRNQILLESVAAQATAHDRDISSSGFTARTNWSGRSMARRKYARRIS